LQESGKIYESVTYPGSKHGIYGKPNQIHVHKTIADFFERHLLSAR
jgi:dipeptidyl-peptidase 4